MFDFERCNQVFKVSYFKDFLEIFLLYKNYSDLPSKSFIGKYIGKYIVWCWNLAIICIFLENFYCLQSECFNIL